MWSDKGSANEMPSFAIGECFVCKTDRVIEQLKKIKNAEQKEFIFDTIEWGLENNFYDNKNVEYNQLKTRLDNERENNR
jgi:hypothetical protein